MTPGVIEKGKTKFLMLQGIESIFQQNRDTALYFVQGLGVGQYGEKILH